MATTRDEQLMWMHPEDARSDFILAAAATLLGGFVVSLIRSLPIYPGGIVGALLELAWLAALTFVVPVLLTRYRDQGPEAFGLETNGRGWVTGLVLAVPVIVVGLLRGWPTTSLPRAALGRLGGTPQGPTVGAASLDLTTLVLAAAQVLLLAAGAVLLYTFLITRARDAFRRTELSVTEALRTFGMAAAGVALLMGLLRAISVGLAGVLDVAALVVIVLLADRLVPTGATTARATVLAPAIVTVLAHVLGAGSFRGDILLGLYSGALAAGLVIVVTALVESRQAAWAAVPLLAATALYPGCLSLLAFDLAFVC